MADGASFQIDVGVQAAGVNDAATALDTLTDRLTSAGAASTAAAAAVTAGEAAYNQAETTADRAARAVERIGLAADAQRGKLAAAMDAGDGAGADRAAAKLAALTARQAEAVAAADAANGALAAQASSLDALKAAAASAASEEASLSAALEAEKSAAEDAAAAAKASSGNTKDFGQAMNGLPGPIGNASRGVSKWGALIESAGAAGPYLAAAAVFAAITVGVFAATVAIAAWGVSLADASRPKDLLSLDNQMTKFKKNIQSTFGGLKIDGLLSGISTLVALFDSTTASGKALKFLFESLFQPVIDGATAMIPAVERAFLQAEVLALKAYIALKPYKGEIKLLAEILGGLLVAALVIVGISIFLAFLPLMIVVGAAVAIVYVLVKAVGLIEDGFNAVSGAVGAAGSAISGAFSAAIAWLSGLSLADIGSKLIMGLVNGIAGSAGAIVQAITGAVGGAISAAKSLLGIASPSKVFAQIGEHTGEGFAGGVDASADGAQSSLEAMVAPPKPKGGAAGAGGGLGGGLNLSGAVFNFMGVKDAEDAVDMLTKALEDLASQGGGGDTPVPA